MQHHSWMHSQPVSDYDKVPSTVSYSYRTASSETPRKREGMTSRVSSGSKDPMQYASTMYLHQSFDDDYDYQNQENKIKVADVDNYVIGKLLGKGSFGETYLAYSKKHDMMVAYKKILITKLSHHSSAIKEVEALKSLNNPTCNQYIVCYYDSFKISENGKDYFVIVSEYIEGTTLYDYIENNQYSNREIKYIIEQLIMGLKHIHDYGYAHRDIKPENIMITKDDKIKYIDFGLACAKKINNCIGHPGSIFYVPPKYKNIPPSIFASQAHDIWSLGVTLFLLVEKDYPFVTTDNNGKTLPKEEILKNIDFAPNRSANNIEKSINDFLDEILTNDIGARPDIDGVIESFNYYF